MRACAPSNVFLAWAWTCPDGPYIAAWSSPWSGRVRSTPNRRPWPNYSEGQTRRGRESLLIGIRELESPAHRIRSDGHFYTLATTGSEPEHARFVDQSKNGATGPEIWVLDGGHTMQEMVASSGWRSGAVLMAHCPPAHKREMADWSTRAAG